MQLFAVARPEQAAVANEADVRCRLSVPRKRPFNRKAKLGATGPVSDWGFWLAIRKADPAPAITASLAHQRVDGTSVPRQIRA